MDVILLGLLNKYTQDVLKEAKEYANQIVTGGAEIDISGQIEDAIDAFIKEETADGKVNTFAELVKYVSTHQAEFEEISKKIEELIQENKTQEDALNEKTKVQLVIWEDGD